MNLLRRLYRTGVFTFFALIFSLNALQAADSLDFDAGWRFRRGDEPSASWRLLERNIQRRMNQMTGNDLVSEPSGLGVSGMTPDGLAWARPAFDDSDWTALDLPHDWAIAEPFTETHDPTESFLPCSGTGWYRKSFDVPADWGGKKIGLDFDGVMSFAAVWVNGNFAGGWPYGYTSFRIDMTPFLKPGETNTLAVRVTHPAGTSRWYTGGGIYRHVRLVVSDPVHIARWGVFVRAENVTSQSAAIAVSVTVQNQTQSERVVRLRTVLFRQNPDGQKTGEPVAALDSEPVTLASEKTKTVDFAPFTLENPALWSISDPLMYVAETTLFDTNEEKTLDVETTPFGVRSISFTPDKGFLLNGEKVKIRGCCLHHDLGPLGAAVNTPAMERQLEKLRAAGCNAIRLSHNPAAPEMMDLLDRMGFLVQAEAFDQWKMENPSNWFTHGYSGLYDAWHEKDLRALVRRDRNHPSVIMWSIGNEIPELREPTTFIERTNDLSRIVKEEDSTRPVTSACNTRAAGFNGVQNVLDLFGYNYYGRSAYDEFHEKNPNLAVYGSETTCMMSTRGYYLFPVEKKWMKGIADFSHSSYCWQACDWDPAKPLAGWAAPPDIELAVQEKYPWVSGEFIWTGIDYLGAPYYIGALEHSGKLTDPERIRQAQLDRAEYGVARSPLRVCETGLLDTAGFAKDVFWLYRSAWRPDLPTAHLLPHWNWPGREGQVTPVHLFTSGDEVELFLNGESLGRKKRADHEYRICWDDVKYAPGRLEAVVYQAGGPWARDVVETTGEAVSLRLSADRVQIAPNGRDLAFVVCEALDSAGRIVPTASNEVRFTISQGGKIVATDNGDGRDWTPYSSTQRKLFAGKGLAVVSIEKGTTGPVILTAESDNMERVEIVINGNK